jgi:hypothetical protein
LVVAVDAGVVPGHGAGEPQLAVHWGHGEEEWPSEALTITVVMPRGDSLLVQTLVIGVVGEEHGGETATPALFKSLEICSYQ